MEAAATTENNAEGSPGLQGDDEFIDQEGRKYALVQGEVSEDRAYEAAKAGATVVWDPCGCGGACGLDWYSREDVARMVAWGPPDIRSKRRRRGSISEWQSEDGHVLLLAEDSVRWADLLA